MLHPGSDNTKYLILTLSGFRTSVILKNHKDSSAFARAPELITEATTALAAHSATARYSGLTLQPKSAAASNILFPHSRCKS